MCTRSGGPSSTASTGTSSRRRCGRASRRRCCTSTSRVADSRYAGCSTRPKSSPTRGAAPIRASHSSASGRPARSRSSCASTAWLPTSPTSCRSRLLHSTIRLTSRRGPTSTSPLPASRPPTCASTGSGTWRTRIGRGGSRRWPSTTATSHCSMPAWAAWLPPSRSAASRTTRYSSSRPITATRWAATSTSRRPAPCTRRCSGFP